MYTFSAFLPCFKREDTVGKLYFMVEVNCICNKTINKKMSKKYNRVIFGCGNIVWKFRDDLRLFPNARLYATAFRHEDRGQGFCIVYEA